MKPVKKTYPKRVSKTRLKKFSKHWLDAVKLADVSVLASSASGGSIAYQVASSSPIYGVGAFVAPWVTTSPASNPPVFNFSSSYISLSKGAHFGMLAIEHVGAGQSSGASAGSWRIVAYMDGNIVANSDFEYDGSSSTYLEIDIDSGNNWVFWGSFGSVSVYPGPVSPNESGSAQFGSSAGEGDYLMYNGFSNCAINSARDGWVAPNFGNMQPAGGAGYTAVGPTADSVLFQDNPGY